ncbi:MAG: hypothetical protein UR93_C0004G0012 [Berkelbacteria bacterium GW2011_GWA2_35_9]|uniref:Zinc/iron permease n=1 Tax=Berkelbacteria bacterium GW2011_GWA2_35_9 TaxID=1618333 RepID=A0A0G0D455_9BACT|nr:MAG: hypothetical protein UR93_C0004G0012 [Berkelbacteria bacterium GW2011_GWA2_35_9]
MNMRLEIYYPLVATLLVSSISFIGILFLGCSAKILKKYLMIFVAFSTGALFGDVFIHILPTLAENNFNANIGIAIFIGIMIFFVLEKLIFWRHCHIPTTSDHPHPLVWTNLVGDGLHNFIDGIMIASSFLISPSVGIATTIAVVMHEIPQEIGDFSILIHGGFTISKAIWFNLFSSVLAILGAIFVIVIGDLTVLNINYLLAVTAGGFIYLAGSDLIPELKKEFRPLVSLFQLLAIIFGALIMLVLTYLE